MNYDDPPEPSDAELQARDESRAAANEPTLRIEGVTPAMIASALESAIERKFHQISLSERIDEAVDRAVQGAVTEVVRERFKSIADETLRPMIAKVVAEGWHTTNSYGEKTGQVSFDAMLRKTLFDERNSYGFCFTIYKEELQKALQGELGAALKEAQLKVRQMLDEEVMGRFQKALREGLGLKA